MEVHMFVERRGNALEIEMERMRKTILIVDDNEALLDALDVLLSDNYTVIPAADAYQALEILAEAIGSETLLEEKLEGEPVQPVFRQP